MMKTKFFFWLSFVVIVCQFITSCGGKKPPISVEFYRSEEDGGKSNWMKYENTSHNETLVVHFFEDGRHYHSVKMLPGGRNMFSVPPKGKYEINVEGYEQPIKGEMQKGTLVKLPCRRLESGCIDLD